MSRAPGGRLWRLATASILVAVVAAVSTERLEAVPAAGEYEIKAELVERFTRFVSWPEESLPATADGHFVIGVLDGSSVGRALELQAADRSIHGHPVDVRRLEGLEEIESCHVLFIDGTQRPRLSRILSRTEDSPILTIGDTEGFGEEGVLINLFIDSDTVGFEINPEAVERSGLVFSSKLMKLARRVGEEDD